MYGDLASITPPITVPAWACAMTGKTPGQLGIYGFRNRKDTSYDGLQVATSLSVKEPAVWDALGARRQAVAADRRAARLPAAQGVPGLARGAASSRRRAPSRYAFPAELETEIEEELGEATSTSSTSRTSASRAPTS